MAKAYTLAGFIYVENGWYGDRYRYMLHGEEGEGFSTKREAYKWATLMKKYIKRRKNRDAQITVAENTEENFPTYKYGGAGPSWSCKNIEIFVEDLENEEHLLEIEKQERYGYNRYSKKPTKDEMYKRNLRKVLRSAK